MTPSSPLRTSALFAVLLSALAVDASEEAHIRVHVHGHESKSTSVSEFVQISDSDFALHALAIGDWGVTSDPTGSCCSRYKGEKDSSAYYKHRYAQDNVAALLGVSAERLKPKCVIGHGDSFYWQGIMADDVQARFEGTFESKYKSAALNVPWFNVMGNHDYGGSSFICGSECTSTTEMLKHLNEKFTRQQKYMSPNDDRWKLKDHYFRERVESGGVSVDIFNVDTNYATVHGASQICCQCYGYAAGDNPVCKAPDLATAGKLCAGGSAEMFNACMDKLKEWQDDSLKQLAHDAKASNATWKVVNSHYSPHFHMSSEMYKAWYDVLKDTGVQLFLNGHTHAESHDYSSSHKVHFVTNGAGGGIQSESVGAPPDHALNSVGVDQVWSAPGEPYGFFELSFSKTALRLQFISTGSGWKPEEQAHERKVAYCHVVPVDGGIGKKCLA